MAQQFNFEGYGYMGVNPDIRQEGRGFSGRMLSLHSAAAKPREGPRAIRTQDNFDRAMQYFATIRESLDLLITQHNTVTTTVESLETYKDVCLGLRNALGLTEGVFAVKTDRVLAEIIVPRQDIVLVTEMINNMKEQIAEDNNGQQRRPVTHINAICDDAERIVNEFQGRGGVVNLVVNNGVEEYALNNNNLAANIVPLIPIRNVRLQQGQQRRSLWATALARLTQFQDNRADLVKRALAVLRYSSAEHAAAINAALTEFRAMTEDLPDNANQQANRFSQMSNVDNVFNVYYWFWWLKGISGREWGFQEFRDFLNVVRAVYYSDVGAARARAILANMPSIFARMWTANSNAQASRFQAPWNPHFQRLRWVSLFVPTEVNRVSNPETLSYGYETCFTNWRTDNPEFWNLLTSVYVAENQEGTIFSASEHTLHRLLVGFKSPLQNTQNVRGNATNVIIVPGGPEPVPQQLPQIGFQQNNPLNQQQFNQAGYQQNLNQQLPIMNQDLLNRIAAAIGMQQPVQQTRRERRQQQFQQNQNDQRRARRQQQQQQIQGPIDQQQPQNNQAGNQPAQPEVRQMGGPQAIENAENANAEPALAP